VRLTAHARLQVARSAESLELEVVITGLGSLVGVSDEAGAGSAVPRSDIPDSVTHTLSGPSTVNFRFSQLGTARDGGSLPSARGLPEIPPPDTCDARISFSDRRSSFARRLISVPTRAQNHRSEPPATSGTSSAPETHRGKHL